MIALRGIEKVYGQGSGQTFVLRRITVDVQPGEFLSIMGPSGAGKSTLLHILGMHDRDWAGEYDLLGHPVHRLKPKDCAALSRQHIGFVFQSYHLLDDLTVYENLEVPLSYRNVSRKERQSMVCDTLDRFQIVGKKDGSPKVCVGAEIGPSCLQAAKTPGFVTVEMDKAVRTETPPIIRLLGPDEEAANRAHDDITEKASGNTAPPGHGLHHRGWRGAGGYVHRASTPVG